MPKIRAYDFEEKRRNRWSVVEAWRTKQDYKFEDIGRLWDCAKSTVSMRKKHPEYMTILEIESMNLTDEQIVALVRGK